MLLRLPEGEKRALYALAELNGRSANEETCRAIADWISTNRRKPLPGSAHAAPEAGPQTQSMLVRMMPSVRGDLYQMAELNGRSANEEVLRALRRWVEVEERRLAAAST